jgi:hypothetical protein
MKIELHETTVRELREDYQDNDELGVRAYGGRLDVRPPYQREFVYKDKQRDAVVDTVIQGFPLNVMYWAVRDDGNFEIIDGQQRTISICQYVEGDFSVPIGRHQLAFHNLQRDQQEQILDYKMMIYRCTGTDSERLAWFETINIAGLKLTDQELRNAVYAGSWVTDAKRYFSRANCAANGLGGNYMGGQYVRQAYLETVISWINAGDIEGYMARQQHKPNATELWLYFKRVIDWVTANFPVYRIHMKGVGWGDLYNDFGDNELDAAKLEVLISGLMADDDVSNKKGIYSYVLNGKEKHLNIRAFSPNQRREAYERQKGICPMCKENFVIGQMEGDHITPWNEGGKTIADNCQMLCKEDNRRKWDI